MWVGSAGDEREESSAAYISSTFFVPCWPVCGGDLRFLVCIREIQRVMRNEYRAECTTVFLRGVEALLGRKRNKKGSFSEADRG